MKKKIFIILIILIILIVVSILGLYTYKINEFNTDKKYEDNIQNANSSSSNNLKVNNTTKRKYVKIEDLPKDYTAEQALEDECVVLTYKESKNKEILQKFIQNVNNNIPDYIRILEFTAEGDEIIKDLELNEHGIIYYTVDNTRDEYMDLQDRVILYEKYDISEYKIIEDEYKNKKYVYFENINKDFKSREYICTYTFNLQYNNNFNLIYERRKDLGIDEILKKGEVCNYSVYSFGGNTKIEINGEKLNLRDAILNNKISIDDIIRKCADDEINKRVETSEYSDGGTTIYKYKDYWIVKCYTLDGNRDIFIGMPNMSYNNGTVNLNI